MNPVDIPETTASTTTHRQRRDGNLPSGNNKIPSDSIQKMEGLTAMLPHMTPSAPT